VVVAVAVVVVVVVAVVAVVVVAVVVVALLLALLKFSFVRRPVEAVRGIRITQCVRLSARPPSLCE